MGLLDEQIPFNRRPDDILKRNLYVYICIKRWFFLLGHISLFSHLSPQRRVGWAQFDPVGLTLLEV